MNQEQGIYSCFYKLLTNVFIKGDYLLMINSVQLL